MTNSKKGFTLAEVLITLGIIGVVAAMTLPTLVQNYKEKQTVVQLKKFYSQLEQAFRLNLAENPEDYDIVKIAKYLKVTKYCTDGDFSCTPNRYKYYFGTIAPWGASDQWPTTKYAKLTDGKIIRYANQSTTCILNKGTNEALQHVCGEISIDINGNNQPNTIGKDVFFFYVTSKGIIPVGTKDETSFPFRTNSNVDGYGFSAWVLYNENLDYLHCNDLSWNGKKTCK